MDSSLPGPDDAGLLHSAFEDSPIAILVLGKATLIIQVNREAEKLTGYSREELEGKARFREMVLAEDQEKLQKILRSLKTGESGLHEQQECRFLDKQGNPFTVRLSGKFLCDEAISILFLTNITSLKEQENLLREARLRAEASERLKTAFLSNISHEIRTPMNAIVGFASLLQKDGIAREQQELYLAQIINGSADLLRLIDKTIILSRIDLGQMRITLRQFFLNETLKILGDKYSAMCAESGNELVFNLEYGRQEDFAIQADQARIQDVLHNLLDNAIKFTREGSITLGYAYMEEEMDNGEDAILFYVKDTGMGISSEKQDIIFDRFVKLVDRNETVLRGAGLGLAISRDLVRLMGGELWVESDAGAGSSFYFTLPVSFSRAGKLQATPPAPASEAVESWGKYSILIAEDIEFNYLYIKELLSETGIIIFRARDGYEAVEIFRKHPEINLILMDVLMPGLDGYEATRLIREINPDIPIIAQTAFTFEGEIQNGLYAGSFNDYIMKPFSSDMLIAHLKKHLGSAK